MMGHVQSKFAEKTGTRMDRENRVIQVRVAAPVAVILFS